MVEAHGAKKSMSYRRWNKISGISLVSHSMREDATDHSAKAVSFRLAYLWCCISFSKWNLWLALYRIACIISPAALTSNSPFTHTHTHSVVQQAMFESFVWPHTHRAQTHTSRGIPFFVHHLMIEMV